MAHSPSGRHDPNGGVQGVEDNPGRRLRIEIGGFLGHHLAGPRDGDHVRNGRGPDQESSLGLASRHPVKNGAKAMSGQKVVFTDGRETPNMGLPPDSSK